MSNKLIKNNNKVAMVANKLEKMLNNFTNWGFSTVPQGDGYLVGTSLSRNNGQVMNVVFEVQKSEVVIQAILPSCKFDEEMAKKEILALKLPIPVGLSGTSGELLFARCSIPTKYVNSDTNIIIGEIMIPIVSAMTKIALAA